MTYKKDNEKYNDETKYIKVFRKYFKHYRTGKIYYASDYGHEYFVFYIKKK